MNRRKFVATVAAIPVLAPGCRRTEPPDDGPRADAEDVAPVLHGEIVPSPMVDSHVMAAYDRQAAEYRGCRFIDCTIASDDTAAPAMSVYWPET